MHYNLLTTAKSSTPPYENVQKAVTGTDENMVKTLERRGCQHITLDEINITPHNT